jgi:hypothetical protein
LGELFPHSPSPPGPLSHGQERGNGCRRQTRPWRDLELFPRFFVSRVSGVGSPDIGVANSRLLSPVFSPGCFRTFSLYHFDRESERT